jgi:hypothetical protein
MGGSRARSRVEGLRCDVITTDRCWNAGRVRSENWAAVGTPDELGRINAAVASSWQLQKPFRESEGGVQARLALPDGQLLLIQVLSF